LRSRDLRIAAEGQPKPKKPIATKELGVVACTCHPESVQADRGKNTKTLSEK
jgi:hypothetical protein